MKIKTIKMKSPKIPKTHITRHRDRSWTSAQRRKFKEKAKPLFYLRY